MNDNLIPRIEGVMGKYRIGGYFNKIFKSPYNPDEYIQIYMVAGNYYVAEVWVPLGVDIIDTPYQTITTINGKWYGEKGSDYTKNDVDKRDEEIEKLKKFVKKVFPESDYKIKFLPSRTTPVEIEFKLYPVNQGSEEAEE